MDILDYIYPEVKDLIQTDAHDRVEVILQRYALNRPENYGKEVQDGMILHLVNLTGFSGNTYFNPLPVLDMKFKLELDFNPSRVWGMVNETEIPFTYKEGRLRLEVEKLEDFEGIVIDPLDHKKHSLPQIQPLEGEKDAII